MTQRTSIDDTVRKYSDMLYRLAYAKTGNSHDAQDVIQEAFLKLMRHESSGKSFNDEEHKKAWLIRVTANLGVNVNRSMYKRGNVGEFIEGMEYSGEQDENISRLETRTVVYPAVMSLPKKYRVIIHLFYYEDMPIAEICNVTGLGVNTVKSRLHRARNLLREKLKEVDFDELI
jgi:RNA polymerase sigma-70 factor (ECF subfamily)